MHACPRKYYKVDKSTITAPAPRTASCCSLHIHIYIHANRALRVKVDDAYNHVKESRATSARRRALQELQPRIIYTLANIASCIIMPPSALEIASRLRRRRLCLFGNFIRMCYNAVAVLRGFARVYYRSDVARDTRASALYNHDTTKILCENPSRCWRESNTFFFSAIHPRDGEVKTSFPVATIYEKSDILMAQKLLARDQCLCA